MKTASNSYFKVLLVIVAWLILIIVTYSTRDHHALFYILGHRLGFAVAVVTTLIVFFMERIHYKSARRMSAFMASITAGIGLVVWLILLWKLKQRDNTPSVLLAQTGGKFTGESLDLRKNNTFKLTAHRLFETEYFRGTYKLKDSLLILDYASARKELETNRFLIRSVSHGDLIRGSGRRSIWYADTTTSTLLIPIDDDGVYMETARTFWVSWRTTF